jgi:hypothetical protein
MSPHWCNFGAGSKQPLSHLCLRAKSEVQIFYRRFAGVPLLSLSPANPYQVYLAKGSIPMRFRHSIADECMRRLNLNNTPSIQSLLKKFLFPTIAGVIIGTFSIGIENIFNVIKSSIAAGADFMFVVVIMGHFLPIPRPASRKHLAILYAAAGTSSGITWWACAHPPFSPLILPATGGILALAWIYTGIEY